MLYKRVLPEPDVFSESLAPMSAHAPAIQATHYMLTVDCVLSITSTLRIMNATINVPYHHGSAPAMPRIHLTYQ